MWHPGGGDDDDDGKKKNDKQTHHGPGDYRLPEDIGPKIGEGPDPVEDQIL